MPWDIFVPPVNNSEAPASKSVNETRKYLANLKLESGSAYGVDGVAVIGSPDSLIFMQALGDSAGPVIFDIVGTKGGYGSAAGGNNEGVTFRVC